MNKPWAPVRLWVPMHLGHARKFSTVDFRFLHSPMENPIDRTIRLMAIAAGVASLFVYVVFQFV